MILSVTMFLWIFFALVTFFAVLTIFSYLFFILIAPVKLIWSSIISLFGSKFR